MSLLGFEVLCLVLLGVTVPFILWRRRTAAEPF